MGLQFGEHTDSYHNLTDTKRGELHYMRLRHAGDTLLEGFVSRKPSTVADVEGAGGTARPGRGAGRKWRAGPRDGGSGGLTGATKFAQQHAFST